MKHSRTQECTKKITINRRNKKYDDRKKGNMQRT